MGTASMSPLVTLLPEPSASTWHIIGALVRVERLNEQKNESNSGCESNALGQDITVVLLIAGRDFELLFVTHLDPPI